VEAFDQVQICLKLYPVLERSQRSTKRDKARSRDNFFDCVAFVAGVLRPTTSSA